MKFTAIIEEWDTAYVAHCPELDICSQWVNLDDALKNLQEAVQLYLEELQDKQLIKNIFNKKLFITSIFANA
jgi:predicted RNase H-like HicB family nuclease